MVRMMNILLGEDARLDRTLIIFLIYANNLIFLGNDINRVKNVYTRLIEVAEKIYFRILMKKKST